MTDIAFTPDLNFDLSELTTVWDAEHWFPFIEDENANITGPGHMDKVAFARLVDQFDEIASGASKADSDRYAPGNVAHKWVVAPEVTEENPEGAWMVRGVTPETPGAFAITTIWGVR